MALVKRPAPTRIATWLAGLVVAAGTAAGQPAPTEYQLKAVFLYSFTKYVQWPEPAAADAGGPLALCVLGDDPFGPLLDEAVAGETVRGRRLTTRRIPSVTGAGGCHVLFVSASESDHLPEILTALEGRSVLTVSDSGRFAERGGMIGMIEKTNRIGLAINVAAAERARLTISSQLLKLGEIVGSGKAAP